MSADATWRAKQGVLAVIRGLALPGIVAVHSQIRLDTTNLIFPCIAVTSEGESEELAAGDTTNREDWFPLRVCLMDNDDPMIRHDNEEKYLTWRRALLNAFHQRPRDGRGFLPGSPETQEIKVIPRVIYDPKIRDYGYMVSGFVLRLKIFETRR